MSDTRNYFKSSEVRGDFINTNNNGILAKSRFDGDIDTFGNLNMKVNAVQEFAPLKSIYVDNTVSGVGSRLSINPLVDYQIFSLSLWLKVVSLAQLQCPLLFKPQQLNIAMFQNGPTYTIDILQPSSTSTKIVTSNPLNYNEWYHVAITFNYTTPDQRLYINSVIDTQIGTSPITFVGSPANKNINLFNNNPSVNTATVYCTELYMFEKVLSQSDVNVLYSKQMSLSEINTGIYTQMPFYYRFMEIINTNQIIDSSSITPDMNINLFGNYSLSTDLPNLPALPVVISNSKNITFVLNGQNKILYPADLNKIIDGTFSNGQVYTGDITTIQNNIADNTVAISNNSNSINSINGQVSIINTNLTTNNNSINTINGQITTINSQVSSNTTNINNVTNQLNQSVMDILTDINTTNSQVNTLTNKTNSFEVVGNGIFFNKHIKTDVNHSIILDGLSTIGEQLIKFYGHSYITQIGDNVINYMKNIELAPNCSINGLSTIKLAFLQSISSDIQTQLINITNKTDSLNVLSNEFIVNKHIKTTDEYSIILNGNSITGEGLLKFYGNSYILQDGLDVTNFMKNIILSPTSSINGVTPTTLSYLQNISSDVQTQITDINTNLSNNTTNINNLQNTKATITYVNDQDANIINAITILQNSKGDISYVDSQDTLLQNQITNNTNAISNLSNNNPLFIGQIAFIAGLISSTITHNLNLNMETRSYQVQLQYRPAFSFNDVNGSQVNTTGQFILLSPQSNSFEGVICKLTANTIYLRKGDNNICKWVDNNNNLHTMTEGIVRIFIY